MEVRFYIDNFAFVFVPKFSADAVEFDVILITLLYSKVDI